MSLTQVITAELSKPETNVDTTALVNACVTCPDLNCFTAELWALHMTRRNAGAMTTPFYVNRDVYAPCMDTFLCATLATVLGVTHLTLRSFPLLEMNARWYHAMLADIPISHLPQSATIDALIGLHWFLVSDIFAVNARSATVVEQARTLLGLLRARVSFLLHQPELDIAVLDVPDYRVTTSVDGMPDLLIAHASAAMVFDCEALISSLMSFIHDYDTSPPLVSVLPARNLDLLKNALVENAKTLDPQFVIKERMEWQYQLQVHPVYTRLYKRSRGLDYRPKLRHILTFLYDHLESQNKVVSFQDVVTPAVDGPNAGMLNALSLDTLFWLRHASEDSHVRLLLNSHIWFDHVRMTWVVKLDSGLHGVSSFTHGFVELRLSLGASCTLGTHNLGCHDKWIVI